MTRSPQWDDWVAEARAVNILDVVKRGRLNLKANRGELNGPCPQCGGDDRFWVSIKKQKFGCRGCKRGGDVIAFVQFVDGCDFNTAVETLTGKPPPKSAPQPKRKSGTGKLGKIVATYPYQDEAGQLLFEVVRYDPKDFRQRRPDSNGGWIPNIDDVRRVPYRLPQLIASVTEGRAVFVVEGEKDVATAETLGLAATTSPGGVGMGWRDEYDQHFAGADVVVVPDNDDDPKKKGEPHAKNIANHLQQVARRVRWLKLPAKDLTEFVEAGGTRHALDQLVEAAPDYQQQQEPTATAPNGNGDDAEIERLAKLSALDYEKQRKAAAEKLDVRAPILDKLVTAKRAELGLDASDGKQGHAIEFVEPEPWPEPVDGAKLLDEIADAIRAHVVMSDEARDRCALFSLHTYLTDASLISPRLAIQSPTKRCGKTTLLDVLARLVLRPLMAANTTAAVVFRVIEGHRPTLMVDEADTFLRDNEELRGVLNAGHRKGGTVLRNVGDDHEPRAFAVYGAVVIALIGDLPNTLADRAIAVMLKRRLPTEPIEPFRLDRTERLDMLARKAARWANDNRERIRDADPEMPDGVFNRDADNWRPLLAIADAAGGHWPERARKAAIEGLQTEAEGSRLEMLLADIRTIFETSDHLDRIASADLIARLVENPDRPWAEYSRGKPITQAKLARMLSVKGVAITAQVIRIGDGTPRGYYRHQFKDAFARLLSQKGAFKAQQRNNADGSKEKPTFQSATDEPLLHFENGEKPNNDGLCYAVALSKADSGNESLSDEAIEGLRAWYVAAAWDANGRQLAPLNQIDTRLIDRLSEMVPPGRVAVEARRVAEAVHGPGATVYGLAPEPVASTTDTKRREGGED
jgi:Protein of unknown function (DUF3631)/CHC2 zinc finger